MPSRALWGVSETDIWFTDQNSATGAHELQHWSGGSVQALCATCSMSADHLPIRFWGTAANDIFILGRDVTLGEPFIRHWNGASWSELALPPNNGLWNMHGSGATDVYAVGEDGLVLRYDGTAWTTFATLGIDLRAVWAFAPNDVFVAGAFGSIFHYDGIRWTPVRGSGDTIVAAGGARDVLYLIDESGLSQRLIRTVPL